MSSNFDGNPFDLDKPKSHRHRHHRARLSAPELHHITITFEDHPMAIAGSNVPVITLTITLPTTRVDGTAAPLSQIGSVTILRDSGSGPVPLGSVINGPFSGPTVGSTDAAPATGTDTYSFFATDTTGTQGVTSAPVSVTVAGAPPLAQLSAGSMTAVSSAAGGTTPPAGVPPTITTQPQATSVALGSPATFTVVAAGDAPLSYQWSENNVAIAGATSATLVTAPTTAADNQAVFTVQVTNASGSATSAPAILTAS
jgi:hypothetical protein